jgi:hypothetical protein
MEEAPRVLESCKVSVLGCAWWHIGREPQIKCPNDSEATWGHSQLRLSNWKPVGVILYYAWAVALLVFWKGGFLLFTINLRWLSLFFLGKKIKQYNFTSKFKFSSWLGKNNLNYQINLENAYNKTAISITTLIYIYISQLHNNLLNSNI